MTDDPRAAAGRALAALRHSVAGICAHCGAPFTGMRKRRYCTNACRWQAAKRRKRKTP